MKKTIISLLIIFPLCNQAHESAYQIAFNTINGRSFISVDGKAPVPLPASFTLTHGTHTLILKRKDHADETILFSAKSAGAYSFRHQKKPFTEGALSLNPLGVFPCGKQPKQINFSPDSLYIFIPLLDDEGFQIFGVKERKMLAKIKPGEPYSKKGGFVEGCFIRDNSFLVSQMTTGKIFEYDTSDISSVRLKRILDTYGKWPKVVAYSPGINAVAVSNWITNDVAIINYADGSKKAGLTGIPVPRGLAFSDDGKFLYLASFEGGLILKYATKNWKETGRIFRPNAAMRHIVLSPGGKNLYVSNMGHNEIYEIDASAFKITGTWKAFSNPNTIDLTPDGKYLFISNRGPNNPKSYILRSPENGRIQILDTAKKTFVGSIDGGAQPTGLDISPDGKLLAFSNFQDDNIEIFELRY